MAYDFSTSNVQLLRGSGYQLGDTDRTIATFELANSYSLGDFFFFFDATNPFTDGTSIYGEISPRFSVGKIINKDLSFSIFKDLLVTTTLETGNDIRRYLYGLAIDLKIPYFQFLKLNFYIRDDQKIENDYTMQTTIAWRVLVPISITKLIFEGFFDYAGGEGDKEPNIMAAPRLLIDIGSFWKDPTRIEAGVEFQIWKNKFGVKDVNEFVPQAMVKYIF